MRLRRVDVAAWSRCEGGAYAPPPRALRSQVLGVEDISCFPSSAFVARPVGKSIACKEIADATCRLHKVRARGICKKNSLPRS